MPNGKEELDSSEDTLETNETVEHDDETEENQDESAEEKAKRNKSNWKKTAEKAKRAEALEKRNAELEAELEEWKEMNPDIAVAKKDNARIEKMEEELFLSRNPEAEEYVNEINATMKKYSGMDRKDAWKFLKADLQTESKSKSNFSAKSAPTNTKKPVEEYSMEEALKLKGAGYEKWAKANKMM